LKTPFIVGLSGEIYFLKIPKKMELPEEIGQKTAAVFRTCFTEQNVAHALCDVGQESWPKIEGRKSIFCRQSKFLVKDIILGRKYKFWSKIEFFLEGQFLVENRTFARKSNFWSKIEFLVGNRTFARKFCGKFGCWSTIDIFS
jgi:hypothetical protein